ncbi:S-formylglutathione hydrolase-like [Planococcus citri]|uniref:S-formylglutathione hydrolase-like n=1 Tax=Planococcus citri TaxID=170843 RepID=UPI0031F77405
MVQGKLLLRSISLTSQIKPKHSKIWKNWIHRSARVQCPASENEMTNLREKFSTRSFGGYQKVFAHDSEVNKCEMRFAIYLPDQCKNEKLPVIYHLSGLTMDHIEYIEKSGSQRIASNLGVIIVAPDSSPRNTNIPGEKDKWNIGTKASYYIDSCAEPWSKHYKMYTYLSEELPKIINDNFPVLPDKQSIMGHSIGGHGAFLIKLQNPTKYKSVSALSPVCDITKAPHSIEGLELYLGCKQDESWDKWSAIKVAEKYSGPPLEILIDQGTDDEYLDGHLFPQDFLKACEKSGIKVKFNEREKFTHNYYFIATFIEDHIKYHMQFLK